MTKELIDKNLEDLAKITQIIQKYRDTGFMPEIEKDIVISKLQAIYECVQQLQSEKAVKVEIVAEAPKQPKQEITKEVENVSPTKEKMVDKSVKEVTKGTNNTGQKPRETIKSKRQNPKIGSKQEVKIEILADQFHQNSFLNEALSQYTNMVDISKKMQSRPLKDISTAIGLNEKFLFIKELFNNNAALYQNTIEKLNNFANFNEAIQYIDEYFEWDFEGEQVQKLLELVHRRYTSTNAD
jgi:phage tail tube protein FII